MIEANNKLAVRRSRSLSSSSLPISASISSSSSSSSDNIQAPPSPSAETDIQIPRRKLTKRQSGIFARAPYKGTILRLPFKQLLIFFYSLHTWQQQEHAPHCTDQEEQDWNQVWAYWNWLKDEDPVYSSNQFCEDEWELHYSSIRHSQSRIFLIYFSISEFLLFP